VLFGSSARWREVRVPHVQDAPPEPAQTSSLISARMGLSPAIAPDLPGIELSRIIFL
jgi:hypothetical protein